MPRSTTQTPTGAGLLAGVGLACALYAVLLVAAPRVASAAEEDEPVAQPVLKSWEVRALTGLQYDSNVALDPTGQRVPDSVADPADGAITLGAGLSYHVLDQDWVNLTLDYDLYQTLHFRLVEYDLRSNRIQATAGVELLPQLWLGAQGGFEQYALGGDGFSREPFVAPFVSYTQGDWGLTQLLYRHGYTTYLQGVFEDIRNGPTDVATLSQTFYWRRSYATVGYEFGSERPVSAAGDDYRFRYNQGYVGVGFTPGWRSAIDVTYVYRHENYTEPNSLASPPFSADRQDDINQLQVALRRSIGRWFSVGLTYYGTFDDSNIDFYTYDRHIVSAEVRFAY